MRQYLTLGRSTVPANFPSMDAIRQINVSGMLSILQNRQNAANTLSMTGVQSVASSSLKNFSSPLCANFISNIPFIPNLPSGMLLEYCFDFLGSNTVSYNREAMLVNKLMIRYRSYR